MLAAGRGRVILSKSVASDESTMLQWKATHWRRFEHYKLTLMRRRKKKNKTGFEKEGRIEVGRVRKQEV